MNAVKWIITSLVALYILAFIISFTVEQSNKSKWQDCRDKIEAKGESLEWKDYIPAPIPDTLNFYKAPKMQDWFESSSSDSNELQGLQANSDTRETITNHNQAEVYLIWSDQFNRDFNLIREALKCPYARMDGSYSNWSNVPMVNFRTVRAVSEVMSQRANCHLVMGQPDEALDEVSFLNDFRQIFELRPWGKPMTMANAMLNVAVTGVYEKTIATGLQSHQWKDAQLIVLQKQLRETDLLPFAVNGIQEENAANCDVINSYFMPRVHGTGIRAFFLRGMYYNNLTTITKIYQQLITDVDLTNSIISPHKVDDLSDQASAVSTHLYNVVAAIILVNFSRGWQLTAHTQTLANQTQIACALERYRLAHGQYPNTLTSLSPQFIQTIPHDIIGGQPLHYSRKSDGTFLLYSVGWNEKDDGGIPSPHDKFGNITNYMAGDWVWPN